VETPLEISPMMLSRDIVLGTIQSAGKSAAEVEVSAAPGDESVAAIGLGYVKSAPVSFNSALFLEPEELVA